METEAFDPNNPEHLKGFERTMKKIANQYKDVPPTYLVIPKELYKKIKRLTSR